MSFARRRPPVYLLALCLMWLMGGRNGAACNVLAAFPPSGDLEKVLDKMDQTAKTFRAAQANFTWTQYNSVVNDTTDKQQGKIYFRRSGSEIQMAADITQPDPKQVIYAHGKVQVFQAKTGVVDVYDAGAHREEAESFLVLGFGAGGHDMLKLFDVKYLGTETIAGRQTAKLDLTPKSEKIRQSIIAHIFLWIDLETGFSLQQQLFQISGDYRMADYSDIQPHAKISDNLFKLKSSGTTKVVNH
jgi:outer membrane lipoprotein-sorting protein